MRHTKIKMSVMINHFTLCIIHTIQLKWNTQIAQNWSSIVLHADSNYSKLKYFIYEGRAAPFPVAAEPLLNKVRQKMTFASATCCFRHCPFRLSLPHAHSWDMAVCGGETVIDTHRLRSSSLLILRLSLCLIHHIRWCVGACFRSDFSLE